MIRVIAGLAILSWIVVGLTHPAQACSPKASSTFCADGWAGQPLGRVQTDEPHSAVEPTGDWTDGGGEQDPSFASGDDIYVEGAVTIGDAPTVDEEPL